MGRLVELSFDIAVTLVFVFVFVFVSNDVYRRAVDEGWNYPANVVLLYSENHPQL